MYEIWELGFSGKVSVRGPEGKGGQGKGEVIVAQECTELQSCGKSQTVGIGALVLRS